MANDCVWLYEFSPRDERDIGILISRLISNIVSKARGVSRVSVIFCAGPLENRNLTCWQCPRTVTQLPSGYFYTVIRVVSSTSDLSGTLRDKVE